MEFSFAARVFALRYLPRAVFAAMRTIAKGAQTEIFLPERQYKNGYKVILTGATVVSSAATGCCASPINRTRQW
jgi:hypothetical protein